MVGAMSVPAGRPSATNCQSAIFQRKEKSGEMGSWLFVGEVEWDQAERYLREVDPIDQIIVSSSLRGEFALQVFNSGILSLLATIMRPYGTNLRVHVRSLG